MIWDIEAAENAVKLARKGKFNEASEYTNDETGKRRFLMSVDNSDINNNLFKFISSWEHIAWHHLIDEINNKSKMYLLELAKEQNFNIFKGSTDEKGLLDTILRFERHHELLPDIFKAIGKDNVVAMFNDKNSYSHLETYFVKHDLINKDIINKPNLSSSKERGLLKSISYPEVLKSLNYQKLLTDIRHIINPIIINNLKWEGFEKELNSRLKDVPIDRHEIESTFLLKKLYMSSSLDVKSEEKLKELVENNLFKPNTSLLSDETQKMISQVKLDCPWMSDETYKHIKYLLKNKALDLDNLNQEDGQNKSLFENLLIANFNTTNKAYRSIRIIQVDYLEIVQELKELQSYGIKPIINGTDEYQIDFFYKRAMADLSKTNDSSKKEFTDAWLDLKQGMKLNKPSLSDEERLNLKRDSLKL
jgi:hypothetical protein